MTDPRDPDRTNARNAAHTILLLIALAWAIGLVMTMVTFWMYQGSESGQAATLARAWVQRWPAPLDQLPVGSPGDCGVGPRSPCAVVLAPEPEGGDAMVRVWPTDNWAKAWLPLSAWRVAHSIAVHAAESPYGQTVLAAGPQGMPGEPPPAGAGRYAPRPMSGHPSWRLSMIVPPDFTGAVPDQAVEQGPTPSVSTTGNGPVVRFADGLVLPARQENDGWTVLAQGPMDQAVRMAAALTGRLDLPASRAPGSPATPGASTVTAVPTVPTMASGPSAPPAVTAPGVPRSGPAVPQASPTPSSGRPDPVMLDPATLLAEPRPDRDDDLRDRARDGERSPRPVLAVPGASAPADPVLQGNDADDGRSRDRDHLRNMPHGRRPMIVEDQP